VLATDTLTTIAQALVNLIDSSNSGAGDPNVVAIRRSHHPNTVILQSRTTA